MDEQTGAAEEQTLFPDEEMEQEADEEVGSVDFSEQIADELAAGDSDDQQTESDQEDFSAADPGVMMARRCKKYLDADRNRRQIACTVCNLSFTGPSNRLRDAVVHFVKCEDTTAGMAERLLHRLTVMQKGKKYGDAKLVKALEKRGWTFD